MVQGFDTVIIGAGSAGCVLAARLSENRARHVALIEAGASVADPDIADPTKWPLLQGRSYDWDYRTTAQHWTAGRSHAWPRGRLLGGSSVLNAMAHIRGHREDFTSWAEAGGARWSYDGLLAGFKRSERFSGGASEHRGGDGPLDVMLPGPEVSPLVRDYMAAAEELGAPRLGDHNSGTLTGTAPNQLTLRTGKRLTVADAYLPATVGLTNLTILLETHAVRIINEGRKAIGVVVRNASGDDEIRASEIIVAAGAIASPLLLMRSGIGDPKALRRAGIEPRHALAGVGDNLQDHLLAGGNIYAARRPVPPSRLQHSESMTYLSSADPSDASAVPDVVIGCAVVPIATEMFTAPAFGSAYTILCGVTHPESRGRILPTGPSPDDPPLIDPAYLSTSGDRLVFRKALRLAREIGHSPALAAWRAAEVLPGPDVRDDAAVDAFLARAAMTHHHPVGTCSMGRDACAVVDGRLAVHGLERLYVVDGSIIPRLTSGPVHAAIIAIAETWAREIAS